MGFEEFRKLVTKFDVLKIPKVIESLSQSLPDRKNKLTYEQLEQYVAGIKVEDTSKLTEKVLE
jgi:hypothetical protein